MGRIIVAVFFLFSLGASAAPGEVPIVGELAEGSKPVVPDAPPARGMGAGEAKPFDAVPTAGYEAGSRNEFGVAIDARLAKAYAAFVRGEPDATLAALDDPRREQTAAQWLADSLRFEALLRLGRAADAEALAERMGPLELKLVQSNASSRAMRGVARMTLGRFDEALSDLGQVATVIGSWSMPVSYMGPPTNPFALMVFTAAQLRAYTAIAVIQARRGDYGKARDWAKAAEALYQDFYYVRTHALYGSGDVPPETAFGRAFNLATLGLAQGTLSPTVPEAVAPLTAARRFFEAKGHAFGQSVAQAYLAQAALTAGRLEDAVKLAEEGERFAATAGLPDMTWQFALTRGETELRRGHADRAEAAFRVALTAIDAVSGALSNDESKLRFGAGKEAVTRHLARLDLARGDFDALFRDLERGRARAFVDLLQGLPMAQGRQVEAVGRIRALEADIRRLHLKNSVGAKQSLATLLAARTNAVAQLRRGDPELADVLGVAAADLAGVQRRLAPGEMLAYAIPGTPEAPLAWLLVTRGERRIETAEISDAALQELLGAFAAAIEAGGVQRQNELVADLSSKLRLKGWVSPKALYVVPSGATHFLPWGALDIEAPVAVLPLGGWLLREADKGAPAGKAAVAGDPDFGGTLPALPGARREAEAVARLYGVSPLLGNVATEPSLRRAVGKGVGVLHLATHGYFRADAPLSSGVVLAGTGKPDFLTAARLVEAPLPARLVVLSACETGVGKAVAGDDFLGLSRSFYLGGARAVLASLWPVDDDATQLFMQTFHERLPRDGFGAAWLAARTRLKREGLPPSAYGAFVLGGALR